MPKTRIKVNCAKCGKETEKHLYRLKVYKNVFCSRSCSSSFNHSLAGFVHSEESKRKMSVSHIGKEPWNKGKKMSENYRKSLRIGWVKRKKNGLGEAWNKGISHTEEHKNNLKLAWAIQTSEQRQRRIEKHSGPNHESWVLDRSTVRYDRRGDPEYKQWRKSVYRRDYYKCKISNKDCSGKLEAHHILNWVEYPELRYEVNNGIILCHAHHPRARAEEKRLSPYFQGLVSVSS